MIHGSTKKQKLIIGFTLFTIYFLLFTAYANAQEDASTAATVSGVRTSVREKVRQTIENLIKKPRAIVGNLNQITDTTLEIKTNNGKVSMIATNKDTKYVRFAKGKKTDIKFEDLVIGDFTVALGSRNENEILEAKRVLTYDKLPFANAKRQSVFGIVQENNKGRLVIKHPKKDQAWTIDTSNKTKVTEKVDGKIQVVDVADLEVGSKIAAIGLPSGKEPNTIAAKIIHVVPGKATGLSKPNVKTSASPKPTASPSPKPKTSPKPSSSPQG